MDAEPPIARIVRSASFGGGPPTAVVGATNSTVNHGGLAIFPQAGGVVLKAIPGQPTILTTNVIDQDFGFYDNGGSQTTPVTLSSFRAERSGDTVRFAWTTASEAGNIGFNLYAQTDAGLRRVNARLIPSRQRDSMTQAAYTFEAKGVAGDRFIIEDVDLRGKARKHGSFQADVSYGSTEQAAPIDWAAIHAEDNRLEAERQVAAWLKSHEAKAMPAKP